MMKKQEMKRRRFIQTTSAGTAGFSLAGPTVLASNSSGEKSKLAILGGEPVRNAPFPPWPVVTEKDEAPWLDVLHKKQWSRYYGGDYVSRFEKQYADLMGVKHCMAATNGTNALFASMNALDIGAGDEVLVPPYTFVATVNVVLLQYAVPVFVDTDPNTFQMDANKIEEKITERTRCIIPVHYAGNMANMDKILAIAKKHNLFVIEDACQAHLAEWRKKKAGSLGDLGCFSFQLTKNLSAGEGGAVISDNTDLMDRCIEFQNNSSGRKRTSGYRYQRHGTNLRMTEFQGALLLQGMSRLEKQHRNREQNAQYLSKLLDEIPGIQVAKMYDGCTRNAYHLLKFLYDKTEFAGVSRSQFFKALQAEGISCGSGYSPLNKEPFIEQRLRSRTFQAVYSKESIDRYMKENHCPANDKLCRENAAGFSQRMLIGSRSDMDQIAEAVRKVHKNAKGLASM